MSLLVKVHSSDNVAIAVKQLNAGTEIEGLHINQDIPQAHKVALTDIPAGSPVIRYGVILGYAMNPIKRGDWINEFMLELPTPPSVDNMEYGKNIVTELPEPPVTTFEGYENPDGGYAGTRNILGISTTVQCVTGVLNVAVKKMKEESGYKNAYVIATGGLGKIIADETECIDLYDPQLTLNGLRMIHEKVQKKR